MGTSESGSPARVRVAARGAAFAAVPVLAALLTGCGGGVGDVSGKITYKGKPVVFGSVSFVGSDGMPRASRINPDGTYAVKDVAVGEAKITVVSDLPNTQPPGKGGRGRGREDPDAPKDQAARGELGRGEVAEVVDPEIIKKWFPIPADYGDVAKTKLRFTVKKGPNTHDIQLD